MKTLKTFTSSLALLLLTLSLVIGLASCNIFSNLFPQKEHETTTPTPEVTTPNTEEKPEKSEALYYYNFMESISTSDRVAVKVNNLVYEVETDDNTPSGIQKVTSVDVAELEIYVEDGKLGGAAHGKVNMTFFDAVAGYAEFSAVIEGDYLYVVLEGQNNGEDEKVQYKYAINELFKNVVGVNSDDEILSEIENSILPAMEKLLENNKEAINKVLETVINLFFDVQKQADGSVVISLSKAKLLALNENLATKPVAEVLDTYFGKNSFDALVNKVYEILDLKVSEIPAYLKDNGIDYDTLVEKVEDLLPALDAPEDFDIDELLTNSDYSDYAIGMLLLGVEDNSYKTQIEENVISTLRTNSLYDLPGLTDEVKAQVDDVINEIFGYVTFSITTNNVGELSAVHVELNKVPVGGSGLSDGTTSVYYTYYLSFTLDVIANGDINVTWDDIVNKVNNAIVPIPDEIKEEYAFNCSSNDWPYEETIYFQDKEYNAMCYDVWVSMADFDSILSTSITPDCGDWLCYDLEIAQKEYDYRVYFVESDYETIFFLGLGYEGILAKIEQVSGGFNVTYENGETKYIIMSTGAANMLTITAKLFPLVFEGEYEIYETQDYVTYYYNTKTHDYGFYFSQHEYEVTYNKLGETCNDGYEIVYTCSVCGDSYTEGTYYGHEIEYFETDLCDFGLCGGYAYEESCMICGEVEKKELSDSVCYWRMLEDTDEYISYKCNFCGTVKTDRSYTTNAGAICQAQFVDLIIFTRDGKELYKYENIDTIENHTYRASHYEKLGENCEDGYIATNTCIHCGDSYTYTSDRHTGKNLTKTYLSSLGVCGGYIEKGTCDVCNLPFDADYYLSSCNLETIWQEMYSVTEQCTKCGISVVTIYGADPYISIYYKGEEIYRHYGL